MKTEGYGLGKGWSMARRMTIHSQKLKIIPEYSLLLLGCRGAFVVLWEDRRLSHGTNQNHSIPSKTNPSWKAHRFLAYSCTLSIHFTTPYIYAKPRDYHAAYIVHRCLISKVFTIALQFLTSMNRDQLKEFFAGIIREVISEGIGRMAKATGNQNHEDEPMVNIAEAARITGLAVNTIYDKTYHRDIPHYKKGKRVYFRPSELIAWIGAGRVATSDEIEANAVTHVMNNPSSLYGGGKGGNGKR